MLIKRFLLTKYVISRRKIHFSPYFFEKDNSLLSEDIKELSSDSEYDKLSHHYFRIKEAHRCLIIQPYVKWGPKKLGIKPEEQLSEAIALIQTLPSWTIEDTLLVPLDTLDRKTLFKSGSMDRIRGIVENKHSVSAIFVNSSVLKKATTLILQEQFNKPILDRYMIVMKILKAHAISKHAKLQVTLAELYYLKKRSEQDLIFKTYSSEALKLMFQAREQKIKSEINLLRSHRTLLRNKRKKLAYPIVAVVGYTNVGKTSIIKALTGEKSLTPKNQLFATLDVTTHEGTLPCGLSILYIDTVGFLTDIPTTLIECFVATLEDALLADVILLVEDVSSESFDYKRKHVLEVLKSLDSKSDSEGNIFNKIIFVGNKCDKISSYNDDKDMLYVSTHSGVGLEKLQHKLEEFILNITGRIKVTIKIPNGGEEIRWLYQNATVLEETPDKDDYQYVFAKVIISQPNLHKFKRHFV